MPNSAHQREPAECSDFASTVDPIPPAEPSPPDVPGGRIGVAVMIDSLARPGGGERLAVEGVLGLDPTRYERFFVITRWDAAAHRGSGGEPLIERLDRGGVEVIRLERSSRLSLGAWAPLVRLLRSGRVDVLHAHLFGSNVWASVLGTLTRTAAIVAHEHMWAYDAGARLRPLLDRHLIGRLADAFVAVSREGVRGMVAREGIPPEKVAFLPNGVRALGAGDGRAVRGEFGIPATAPLLVSVGHLRPEKSFGTLVEALAELRARGVNAHALIAGEGPEREMLEQLAADLDVTGHLALAGAREDVADLLATADIGVCCSRFEGGPLSVMEYMQAGLPVLATRVGGLPELVADGVTGVLVPPGDARELAAAAAGLIADPARAAALGTAGRDAVGRDYALDVWVRRLETLYSRLLSEPPG